VVQPPTTVDGRNPAPLGIYIYISNPVNNGMEYQLSINRSNVFVVCCIIPDPDVGAWLEKLQ